MESEQFDWPSRREFPAAAEPFESFAIPVQAEPVDWVPPLPPRRVSRRRIILPVMLFLLTCMTTFLHGGTVYMVAVMGILLAHEMGHFLQALRYHVPASLPYFIPMPFSPLGTMGAVIGMQGSRADRRQLFDIGISGPLAGLVLAIPITMAGIVMAQPVRDVTASGMWFGDPLLVKALIPLLRPELPPGTELYMNALLMAGWVGLLVTGLNMLPVSQLDGGHVAYALLGNRAHALARLLILAAMVFIVIYEQYGWLLMLVLVMMIGTDHPPTADDRAEIGPWRRLLGFASLAIPIFCLAPIPFSTTPVRF